MALKCGCRRTWPEPTAANEGRLEVRCWIGSAERSVPLDSRVHDFPLFQAGAPIAAASQDVFLAAGPEPGAVPPTVFFRARQRDLQAGQGVSLEGKRVEGRIALAAPL